MITTTKLYPDLSSSKGLILHHYDSESLYKPKYSPLKVLGNMSGVAFVATGGFLSSTFGSFQLSFGSLPVETLANAVHLAKAIIEELGLENSDLSTHGVPCHGNSLGLPPTQDASGK